ncbi:MAG: DHA2 family efflux MFS transporter permease subunit [Acidimicrobiales bacterium]
MISDPETIHRRRWWTLAVLSLSLLIIVVDNTIVNVALPTLVRELHATTTQLQWIVDAYTLVLAGMLLSMGSLGDRVGRHRALAGGLVVFGVGSALAALSGSAAQLIASRTIMGLGAAMVMPATLSILTNVFTDPSERARAIAMWGAVAGLGIAIGPTAGGWLLEHYSWSSIFVVNIPIVAVALSAGRSLVPSFPANRGGRLDAAGAVLSVAGLVAVVYAVIEAPNKGWGSASTLGVGAAGLAVLAVFGAWEVRNANPMVDLRFFRNPRFSAASLSITLIFFALLGWTFLFTQHLQFVFGYNTLQAGVRVLPFAIAIGVTASFAAQLAERVGTKIVVAGGMTVMAVGLAMVSRSDIHTGFPYLLVASVVVALGMGVAMAPATESIMGALPPRHAGVGSAVNDTTRELGGALGVAVLGSVAATSYASGLHSAVAGLPSGMASAATRSLGAAIAVGHAMPGTTGDGLVTAAKVSFLHAAGSATLVAAGIALVGAAVAAVALPARATEEAEAEAAEADEAVGEGAEVDGAVADGAVAEEAGTTVASADTVDGGEESLTLA